MLYCDGPTIPTSTNKRIDDAHATVQKIRTVSRGNCQTVDGRRRSDEAVLDRHGFSRCLKTRQQFCPFQARGCVPSQTVEPSDSRVEPAFQGAPFPSFGKDENPESQFAENDGSTTISDSCARRHADRALVWSARSKHSHRSGTSQRIRRLRLDGHEEVFLRTGEQPVDGAFV